MASAHTPLLVSVEQQGGVRIITVAGEVDLASLPALEPVLRPSSPHDFDVVVDLTRTGFLDCVGLGLLVEVGGARQRAGRGFAIAYRSETTVARLLSLPGALPIELPAYSSRRAAIASVMQRRADVRGPTAPRPLRGGTRRM